MEEGKENMGRAQQKEDFDITKGNKTPFWSPTRGFLTCWTTTAFWGERFIGVIFFFFFQGKQK